MLKSKLHKTVIISHDFARQGSFNVTPSETLVRLTIQDGDSAAHKNLKPETARQLAYALLLAADATEAARSDREARKSELGTWLADSARSIEGLNESLGDWYQRQQSAGLAVRDAQEALADARNTPKLATGGQVIGDGPVLGTDSSGRQYTEQVEPLTTESIAIEHVAPLLTELSKRVNAADLTDPASSAQARVALEQLTTGAIKRALAAFPSSTPTADGASDV